MQDFRCQTLQVLLIGTCHELDDPFVVLNGVKGLAPVNLSAVGRWLQLNGQNEVMAGQMLDLEEFAGDNAHEAAFVWVVLTVGSVHGE